jgi:hypothetical protein
MFCGSVCSVVICFGSASGSSLFWRLAGGRESAVLWMIQDGDPGAGAGPVVFNWDLVISGMLLGMVISWAGV